MKEWKKKGKRTTQVSVCEISPDRIISQFKLEWCIVADGKAWFSSSSSSSSQGREIPFRDTRAVLRFSADNRNLSGRYTCVANNGIGEPAEAHIDLRIRCECILCRQTDFDIKMTTNNASYLNHVYLCTLCDFIISYRLYGASFHGSTRD